jgi:hypothetical protein
MSPLTRKRIEYAIYSAVILAGIAYLWYCKS